MRDKRLLCEDVEQHNCLSSVFINIFGLISTRWTAQNTTHGLDLLEHFLRGEQSGEDEESGGRSAGAGSGSVWLHLPHHRWLLAASWARPRHWDVGRWSWQVPGRYQPLVRLYAHQRTQDRDLQQRWQIHLLRWYHSSYSHTWWTLVSGFLPGSLSYEETDVQMLLDWEIDYFKYDNCYPRWWSKR